MEISYILRLFLVGMIFFLFMFLGVLNCNIEMDGCFGLVMLGDYNFLIIGLIF